MVMDSKVPCMSAGKRALKSRVAGMLSSLLLVCGLIRWLAKVLLCSQSEAVVVASDQGAGVFIRSEAFWSFRLVISTDAESGGKSMPTLAMLPSRAVPEGMPAQGVWGWVSSVGMRTLAISGDASAGVGNTPGCMVAVVPTPAKPAGVALVAEGMLDLPINHCKAASSSP